LAPVRLKVRGKETRQTLPGRIGRGGTRMDLSSRLIISGVRMEGGKKEGGALFRQTRRRKALRKRDRRGRGGKKRAAFLN